jgi:SOS response regulatory protein OraA/RecX
MEWLEKFNQNNLQSNKRFTESLIRGRLNKGIIESRIRNELEEHQISTAAMSELCIDWFVLANKVFEKNQLQSLQLILKNSRNSNNFYIIVVLYMNKLAMRLNNQKINAI